MHKLQQLWGKRNDLYLMAMQRMFTELATRGPASAYWLKGTEHYW